KNRSAPGLGSRRRIDRAATVMSGTRTAALGGDRFSTQRDGNDGNADLPVHGRDCQLLDLPPVEVNEGNLGRTSAGGERLLQLFEALGPGRANVHDDIAGPHAGSSGSPLQYVRHLQAVLG